MDNRMKREHARLRRPVRLASRSTLRESDPTRSFVNHVMSIDDRPTIWPPGRPTPTPSSRTVFPLPCPLARANGPSTSPTRPPSPAFPTSLPVTSTTWKRCTSGRHGTSADSNWSSRQRDLGIIRDQTRGDAWAFRNIVHAAFLAPDAHSLEKNYFNEKIANNITFYNNTYVNAPPPQVPLDPLLAEPEQYRCRWRQTRYWP